MATTIASIACIPRWLGSRERRHNSDQSQETPVQKSFNGDSSLSLIAPSQASIESKNDESSSVTELKTAHLARLRKRCSSGCPSDVPKNNIEDIGIPCEENEVHEVPHDDQKRQENRRHYSAILGYRATLTPLSQRLRQEKTERQELKASRMDSLPACNMDCEKKDKDCHPLSPLSVEYAARFFAGRRRHSEPVFSVRKREQQECCCCGACACPCVRRAVPDRTCNCVSAERELPLGVGARRHRAAKYLANSSENGKPWMQNYVNAYCKLTRDDSITLSTLAISDAMLQWHATNRCRHHLHRLNVSTERLCSPSEKSHMS
eukprot:comp19811_c0_seq1/m.23801 comp19811_c0_seq1/g.23801  ORF comp19811_c0_seq1/g.23801 comp19811_c0_seq1/m.23801 type:complete len:320 (-) comp19811_c0_seq1:612-1571(-)